MKAFARAVPPCLPTALHLLKTGRADDARTLLELLLAGLETRAEVAKEIADGAGKLSDARHPPRAVGGINRDPRRRALCEALEAGALTTQEVAAVLAVEERHIEELALGRTTLSSGGWRKLMHLIAAARGDGLPPSAA